MLNMKSTLDSPRQLTYALVMMNFLIMKSLQTASGILVTRQNCLQVDWWHVTASSICQQNKGETTPWDYTRYSLKSQSPACMDQST